MSEFFDKYLNIKNIAEEKRKYKQQMARVNALPKDYKYVFQKIQDYMWKYAGGDGMDMLKIHYDLIELFEEGAANGKHVLDVTGKDVAAFADELLKNAKTWDANWPKKLNRDIMKKLNNSN